MKLSAETDASVTTIISRQTADNHLDAGRKSDMFSQNVQILFTSYRRHRMRIPSTQALRALESFARHGSVWRSAEELHLTRSAVSHQLRLLERDLGFDLVERIGKGVALTARGQRYAADVRKALGGLGG